MNSVVRAWRDASTGTGFPGLISLCTRRGGGIHDFAAVYRDTRAEIVKASGAGFDWLVISRRDAEENARMIEQYQTRATSE